MKSFVGVQGAVFQKSPLAAGGKRMKFPVEELLEWYGRNRRDLPWRRTDDIYAIWVSEVMLQQTQVTTVIPYYRRFLGRFPTVGGLAEASEQEVLKLWEGLGYYSRARNLHRAAKQVVERHQGKIPGTRENFRKLPGVGPYTAAAVLSIARGIPIPAVDGNVMRVYTRFRAIKGDIRKTTTRNLIYKELEHIIPRGVPGDFNQALMELGAGVCTPKNPKCSSCPLNNACTAYTAGAIEAYPYKSPLKNVPEYKVSIGIVIKGRKFYIQRRPSGGHLGGLWEFPGGKSKEGEIPGETLARECKEELGTDIKIIKKLAVVRHGYSHFKIVMSAFMCRLRGEEVRPRPGIAFRWITIDELENYPFPGANHKLFPALREFFK
jgi:A/G-specific adenine glycosylase